MEGCGGAGGQWGFGYSSADSQKAPQVRLNPKGELRVEGGNANATKKKTTLMYANMKQEQYQTHFSALANQG